MARFQGNGETPVGSRGGPCYQPTGSAGRQWESDRGAQRGKHQPLGKQLPCDAQAACTERETDADFLCARGGAAKHQIGEVAAGNQQHQAGDAGQHPERPAEALLQ